MEFEYHHLVSSDITFIDKDFELKTKKFVKFKDYGFFMPLDIAGQEAIIEGVAFIEEVSVEDLKHYAEDDGKSPEEIAAITEPKKSLAIVSSGVLLPEQEAATEKDSNPQE